MAKQKTIDDVKAFISIFSGMSVANINDTYVLQEQPLIMNSPQLMHLAAALRHYVKNLKPSSTLLTTEIKQSGLTVAKLIDLIESKI